MPDELECAASATELIVQVDGGHIPSQEQQKRSFEALVAIAYKPENIKDIDRNHRQIVDKNCVASAESDQLKTIKAYLINAAKKQGLRQETKVIGLADGAQKLLVSPNSTPPSLSNLRMYSRLVSHCQKVSKC